jgi:hypothetical protein
MYVSNTKLIITIDTEVGEKAKHVRDGFEKFVLGKIGSEYYGVPKIVEILDEFNFKAEFFVDVYECKFFGEEKYKKLCKFLHKRGHGVQLHTHPSYAYDPNRINMHEYSLEEQTKIISEGKKLIEKWIGEPPIAHRAGNYGADNNTLIALRENNIKVDSSFFYKHPNCKIRLPTINEPIFYNGVLEVPITVVKRRPKVLGIPVLFKSRWLKLDVNWLSYRELKSYICKIKLDYIIIFLHSSSFVLRSDSLLDVKGVNHKDLDKFKKLMCFIYNNSYDVISFEELNLSEILD